MYKGASQTLQGRADKKRVLAIESGDDNLPEHERQEMLKDKIRQLQQEILTLPKKSERRKQIGFSMANINLELSKLKKPKRTGLAVVFQEVAKRHLTREQYNAFEEEARHVWDLRNAPVKEKSAAKFAAELDKALRAKDQN